MALNNLINDENFKQCVSYNDDVQTIIGLLNFLGDSSIHGLTLNKTNKKGEHYGRAYKINHKDEFIIPTKI